MNNALHLVQEKTEESSCVGNVKKRTYIECFLTELSYGT